MVDETRRKSLDFLYDLPEGVVGYDCSEEYLELFHTVEVIIEEEVRKGAPKFEYCTVGKRGKIIRKFHRGKWMVEVEFTKPDGSKETACCTDYHLRKIL